MWLNCELEVHERWRDIVGGEEKEVRGEVTSREWWSRMKTAPYEETPSDILFKGEVRQRAAGNAECWERAVGLLIKRARMCEEAAQQGGEKVEIGRWDENCKRKRNKGSWKRVQTQSAGKGEERTNEWILWVRHNYTHTSPSKPLVADERMKVEERSKQERQW